MNSSDEAIQFGVVLNSVRVPHLDRFETMNEANWSL